MSDENKLFDQQIHDAYEGVSLSDAAQERMLANLLAAQAQAQRVGQEDADDSQQAPEPAVAPVTEVRPRAKAAHLKVDEGAPATARRRRAWKVVLPLAAALLVAAVVVRLQMASSTADVAANEVQYVVAPKSSDDAAAAAEGATEDMDEAEEAADAAVEESLADESSDTGELVESELVETDPTAVVSADLYVRITLEDGTALTTLVDGAGTQEVESARVGTSLGSAKAAPFDEPDNTVSCEVFALTDDADGYAVRYEEEGSYWYATRM